MYSLIAVGVDGAAVILAHECDGEHATSLPADLGPWTEDATHWMRQYLDGTVAADVRKSLQGCGVWHTWNRAGLNLDSSELRPSPKTVEEAKAQADKSLRGPDAWEIEFEEVGSSCLDDLGFSAPDETGLHAWSGEIKKSESGGEWVGNMRKATESELRRFLRGDPVFLSEGG
jgi:hypothetical protein